MRKGVFWAALACALAAAVAPAASQTAPSSSPAPLVTPSTPAASPSPLPTSTSLPTPVPTPLPTPTPVPTPPVLPPDAAPQIVAYSISANVLYSGETITGNVVTSTNVASVEVRIAAISINMPRGDPGQFALSYTVPNLPFFVRRGAYTMQIIARNTRGDAVEQDIPVQLR